MTIVSHDYRPKRARKRKQSPAIPMRIVTAKPPKPGKAAPAIADAVIEQKRPAARACHHLRGGPASSRHGTRG